MKNNSYLALGGIVLLAILLFIGYQIVSVTVGPVKVDLKAPENKYVATQPVPGLAIQPSNPTAIPLTQKNYPASTPYGVSNPTGPVPADMPILIDDFSLTVRNKVTTLSDRFGIEIHVKNVGQSDRLLRYTRTAITVRDDLGNTYEHAVKGKSLCYDAVPEGLYRTEQIDLAPSREVTLYSSETWCFESMGGVEEILPMYLGPISTSARKLIISIDGLGPYNGVQVEIKL